MKQKTREIIEDIVLFIISLTALASPLWLQFILPI